jgi:hypothetical protein
MSRFNRWREAGVWDRMKAARTDCMSIFRLTLGCSIPINLQSGGVSDRDSQRKLDRRGDSSAGFWDRTRGIANLYEPGNVWRIRLNSG